MKISVPISAGKLSPHFGHCDQFALFEVQDKEITETRYLNPPPHEPGLLPRWLHEQGADLIIAGGMGQRAQDLFQQAGIEVICGAPTEAAEAIVAQYLNGELVAGENVCDH